ncbi:MAG: GGDEF domain-containing protein [Vibrio sp.]|uniref:GGDEF domain-containing protein n=1 Tax=Vibrio sp. TaxID=678 RepID=UPI003A848F23
MLSRLYRLSTNDNITQLHNRLSLYRRFRRGFPANMHMVYLDVNKFKQINDTYGHDVGDQMLRTLAHHIKLHWKGKSYRIGGDEFILVSQRPYASIMQMLKPIQQFSLLSNKTGELLEVSVSMGIVKSDGSPIDEIMHRADQEMYLNKQGKK